MKEISIIGEAVLVKFKNEEIIDSLQSGCIYMNSLEVFRKIEKDSNDDKVGDLIDGLFHINNGYLLLEDSAETEELVDCGLKTKYSNDYCYCFWGIGRDNYTPQFSSEQKQKMAEMGEWALIITNLPEFIKRLLAKVEEIDAEFTCDFVSYYDPGVDSITTIRGLIGEKGLKKVAFLKREKYAYQQEFRFVVHVPDGTTDELILQIGDISDISKKIRTNNLLDSMIKTTTEFDKK